MRKIYFLLLCIFLYAANANSQSSANYAFSTNSSGSLIDMNTGTTQLLGAIQDDVASTVTNIGFEFWFMGTRYTQFSVNSNGFMRLGGTAVAGAQYTLGTTVPLIAALGSDEMSSTTGKVHYKLMGVAPNRQLVVEYRNMTIIYDAGAGATADGTSQIVLSETSGSIQLIYGSMNRNVSTGFGGGMDPQWIGFSANSTNNTYATIQNATNAVTTTGGATSNQNTLGAVMPNLNSVADGSRRVYNFASATPAAPTGMNFTAISAIGMTVNWTDNASNEVGYAIYRSDDGGTTYNFVSQTAAGSTSFVQGSLLPSVTYFWRVYAVSEGALSLVLQGSQATSPPGNIASISTGLWSQPGTWSSGAVPTSADNVTIVDGHTVTIDVAAVALNLTVGQGASGVLQFEQATARTLTTGGNVTITTGGTFQSNPAGTVTTHTLSITGNLTNNGTLDFSTNTNTAGAGITFTGAPATSFGGTGAITNVRTITINKGTSNANVLELNPTNFTVRGVTTDVASWLVMTNGTIKISGTFTGTNRVFASAAYTIPATVGFWLNNPNYTVVAQVGNAVNNGLFRITQGVFNQGTLASHSFRTGAGAVFTIEGGTINCAGQFSPQNAVTYTQSGGTLNVGLVGNSQSNFGTFELFSGTATFNMSGGTINVVQASTGATQIDFQNLAVSTITGGTLNIGTGATVTKFTFTIRGNIPGLSIDNTTNNKTATATAQVNLFGNTVINPGTTLTINGQVCLVIGSPTSVFTNNGTLTGTAAGTRFYFLGGGGPTTYTGSGVVTAPLTAFEVDNIAGVTINPAVNQIITSRFNNFSGGVTGSAKLTIGNGGTTTAVVQLGVTGVTQAVNGFDVPPVFNPGTGGVNLLYAPELSGRTTGNEMPPSRTLNLLSITNTNPITIADGDVMVNGVGAGALALGSSRVITNANTLYFNSTTGTVTRSTGYVNGNFKKSYVASGSKNFEVGTANGYSPVTVNATAGTFPADVTVKAVEAVQPNLDPAVSLSRYWTLTASGITADMTFNYLAGDVNGTEADYKVIRVETGGIITGFPASTVNTGTHTANVTGISSFSDWSVGELCTGAVGGTAAGSVSFCDSGIPAITASGYSTGAGSTYQWQSSNDNFVTNIVDIPAATDPATLATGLVSSTTYYRLRVTCPSGTATDFSNTVTVAVNSSPGLFTVEGGGAYCSSDAGALVSLSGSQTGVNYQLQLDGSDIGALVPGTGSSINFGLQSGAGVYTVIATDGTSLCTTTMTGSVTISVIIAPSATISYPDSPYCTFGTTATVTQTGTTGGTYSSTVGLVIDPSTGTVTLGTSTPGTYTVTYTIAASGPCPGFTTTASITINVCIITCIEDFDGVTSPALPSGWSATSAIANGASLPWQTVTSTFSSAPNSVGTNDPATPSDEILDSRVYSIAPTPTQLIFRNNYNLEFEMSNPPLAYDGMVLEISINGGAFADILAAGGSFVTGGYNKTVSTGFSSPIGGRQAWSGNSGGFITTTVDLPAAALGQNVVFRWRRASDASVASTGANIDDVYTIGTATISYAGTPYCGNAGTANVTLTGTPGGTYSSTAGLTISSSTGAVTLGSSTPGSYVVTYTIQESPGCPTFTTTAPIEIAEAPAATISYAGSPYCQNAGTATITQTGTTGGTYSSTAGLTIDASTGAVDLAASTPGTYTVTYTIAAAAPCALYTTTTSITITIPPAATITYAGSPYCQNAGTATVTQAGTTGGTYSSTAGLTINASTGDVTLATSTAGTYTVTYTIAAAGGCPVYTTTASITINATPNAIATPASQTRCSGTAITTIALTSGVAGTTYTWTRDNTGTVTGIAASGSGNISGTLTNTTSAPATVTFTITPTAAGCTGTPITATVVVNPIPTAVATPSSQTVCSGLPITTIVLSGAVTGTTYNWTRNNTATVTGMPASGSGNIGGTLTNTTSAPITVTFTITPTANGCPGTPITATVIVNPTPTVSTGGLQVIITGSNGDFADEITWTLTNGSGTVVLTGGPYGLNPPPTPSAIVASNNGPYSFFIEANGLFGDNSCLWQVRCGGVVVASGCIRGVNSTSSCATSGTLTVNNIAACGSNIGAQTICSGSAITPITLSGPVAGTTFNWTRNNTATVTGIPASGTGDISGTLTNTTNAPVVVAFTITPTANGCNGTPVTVNITVNPIPDAVATPSTQTICSGPITPIVLTGAVSGTTYAWTRNNTANVTGIPASGTGSTISGTLTNTTLVAQTVTFTITPTANGCVGTPITATVIMNAAPTIVCPASFTIPSVVGGCNAVATYAPTVTGVPTPALTYTLTGATTGSGAGTGSGLAFNVGVTTVTITATNVCAAVSCSFTITVTDSQLPTISVQPANRSVCAGSNAVFSVTAVTAPSAGGPIAYQWQQWSGTAWVNVPANGNAATYTVSNVALSQNTHTYRVVLTGLCTVVNSNAATLFVNAIPSVTVSAHPPASLLPNQTTTLTATATPAGGTYQWFYNGTAIPGATSANLASVNIDQLGTYRVVYTSLAGCSVTSSNFEVTGALSDALWVYPNPNRGVFQVRFYNQVNEPATVMVFNAGGQKVHEQKVVTGSTSYSQIEVNLGFKANGIYIVQVVNGSGKLLGAKRIVVQVQ